MNELKILQAKLELAEAGWSNCSLCCVRLQLERDILRNELDRVYEERDGLIELIRKVAPHFAAPPGLGYLHAAMDEVLLEATS